MTVKVQLAGTATWRIEDQTLLIYDDRIVKIEDIPRHAEQAMQRLEHGEDPDELAQAWGDAESFDAFFKLLSGLGLIATATDPRWLGTAVERQVPWLAAATGDGNCAQERLGASHVAIWGIGGVGTVVAAHLAGAGINRLTLIDHDYVRRDNFNRQYLFSLADLGKLKVEAARAWITRTYSTVAVELCPYRIDAVDALLHAAHGRNWDLLVVAADEPVGEVHDIAVRFGARANVTTIAASCGFRQASWGPLIEPKDARQRLQRQPASGERSELPKAPGPMLASFGPTNGAVGSLLAHDIIAYLSGQPVASASRLMSIDFETLQIHAVEPPHSP